MPYSKLIVYALQGLKGIGLCQVPATKSSDSPLRELTFRATGMASGSKAIKLESFRTMVCIYRTRPK